MSESSLSKIQQQLRELSTQRMQLLKGNAADKAKAKTLDARIDQLTKQVKAGLADSKSAAGSKPPKNVKVESFNAPKGDAVKASIPSGGKSELLKKADVGKKQAMPAKAPTPANKPVEAPLRPMFTQKEFDDAHKKAQARDKASRPAAPTKKVEPAKAPTQEAPKTKNKKPATKSEVPSKPVEVVAPTPKKGSVPSVPYSGRKPGEQIGADKPEPKTKSVKASAKPVEASKAASKTPTPVEAPKSASAVPTTRPALSATTPAATPSAQPSRVHERIGRAVSDAVKMVAEEAGPAARTGLRAAKFLAPNVGMATALMDSKTANMGEDAELARRQLSNGTSPASQAELMRRVDPVVSQSPVVLRASPDTWLEDHRSAVGADRARQPSASVATPSLSRPVRGPPLATPQDPDIRGGGGNYRSGPGRMQDDPFHAAMTGTEPLTDDMIMEWNRRFNPNYKDQQNG